MYHPESRAKWVEKVPKELKKIDEESLIFEAEMQHYYQIAMIDQGSPAYEAGLTLSDRIVSLGGNPCHGSHLLASEIQTWNGKEKIIQVLDSDGVERELLLKPRWNENTQHWSVGIGYTLGSGMKRGREQSEKCLRYPLEIINEEEVVVAHGYAILGKERSYEDDLRERKIEKYVFLVKQPDNC